MRYTPPSSPMRHTFSDSLVEENVEIAEALIAKWDPTAASGYSKFASASASLFHDNNRYDAKQFLICVKNLQAAMHYYVKENSASDKLVRAQRLMQAAMKRLEKEFYYILSTNREYLDPESVSNRSSRASTRTSSVSDYEDDSEEDEFRFAGPDSSPSVQSEEDRVSTIVMTDLKAIADCMIASGYGKECVNIYKVVRKSIVDEALYHLGVDRSVSIREIQKMEWEVLERKIRGWLRAVKFSVRTIFYGEQILCDHVFSASLPIRQSCFNEIARDGALALFGFPQSVAKSKKLSAEKMFRTLDMYEAIANLWPEIESIFSYDSTSDVRLQAVNSLIKLGDAACLMLADFESAIEKDSSKSVPSGGVHPLTRYVMNYLAFLADYTEVLSDIIADWPLKGQSHLPESYFNLDDESYSSAMSARIAWVVLLLLCKLDGKAAVHKDVALSYLFLSNNLQYIVSKVRQSNLKDLLGDDWVAQHESKFKQYIANYERVGWSRVIDSLPPPAAHAADTNGVKDYFKRFNAEFESAYRKQLNWVVYNPELRDEIKVSLAKKLLPAYTALYKAHGTRLRRDAFRESVVRFSPEDLGNYLSDLFHGNGESGSVSSHSQASSSLGSSSGLSSEAKSR
ncbi:hypothetical protein CDL15_Pgr024074 [Punica granatum]|nr:hypothetical protein CDL15_Pgr024074 [Punica granatum]